MLINTSASHLGFSLCLLCVLPLEISSSCLASLCRSVEDKEGGASWLDLAVRKCHRRARLRSISKQYAWPPPGGGLGEGPRLLNQRRMKSYRVCVEGGSDGGEMAQKSRALTALPEDVSSVPSTHEAAYNCLSLQIQGIRYTVARMCTCR